MMTGEAHLISSANQTERMQQMKKRKLGKSDIEIAPLALGGNVFGWTADEPTSFLLMDAFVDAGLNLIDTADVYSVWVPGHQGGESETVIGNWLKRSGRRKDVIIATKVGNVMSPEKKGLAKPYILRAVEDSLRRLQIDSIDLYQSHVDDPATPIEETLEAYDELVRAGKVRAIGASNFTAERLTASLDVSKQRGYPSYISLQPHYNLVERADYETNLEPVCVANGIGVIPYFGLASGFLTGKYRTEADLSKSARGSRVQKYLDERGLRVLSALDEVSKKLNSTPARVALAWLIARPSITAPIASATNLDQLKDLIAATELKLDEDSIEILNRASTPAPAAATA
jgi:aryl-alcohol dehydrogenase-like predicted oxidoreductase